jgi:uncharacterized protein YhaN
MDQNSDLVKNIINLREALKLYDQRLSQTKEEMIEIRRAEVERYNEIKASIQSLSSSINASKSKLIELEDAINRLEKLSEKFARLQDVKILDKYLSFVDPSRFLSKEEVIKILDDYMQTKKWG